MATKEQQIKNSFVYLVPVVLGNLLPLITLPIFTRILTKEDYGILALAQAYAIFVTGLANFGLTIGYERNYFEHKEPKKVSELLYSTLAFVSISFIVCAFFTYIFKSSFSKWIIGSPDQGNILFWAFCSAGIMGLRNYYLIYFKNKENAKAFVWYTIDESILGVLFSLFLVVYLRIGVIGLIWGQLLASLIILSILSTKFVKLHKLAFNLEILKDSLKLSYPLTPRIFFGVIGSQFDKYMIGLMSTMGGVGVYSIGQKIANVVFTYMTAIQNVFSPQVYRRMFDLGEEGKAYVGRYLTPFCYVSIFLGLLISLFSEEIIYIVTPPSYHGATDIVIVLSMLYGSYFFGKQPQRIFAKKTYMTSVLTMISIGLNIAINIPFIMKWGAIGAAWGTLLAGLISGAISFVVSQHYYEIKWE
ncbi:MAG: oligosaccharide flippase family protein, partial [Candidatus Saganbacteria bacterium]|nr:oligosaccharide flippase family protein [Candidatus Saganbacteria bacterium]